jgi:hypothetical protein
MPTLLLQLTTSIFFTSTTTVAITKGEKYIHINETYTGGEILTGKNYKCS